MIKLLLLKTSEHIELKFFLRYIKCNFEILRNNVNRTTLNSIWSLLLPGMISFYIKYDSVCFIWTYNFDIFLKIQTLQSINYVLICFQ